MEDEINLREYIFVLRRYWWVIAIVFVIAVGASLLLAGRESETYEARVKLLIIPRVSERLVAQQTDEGSVSINPGLGTSLSVETLSSLATANDLLLKIISRLNLRSGDGELWAVESMAGMFEPKVETAGEGGAGTVLPLLTMTVRGGDPPLLERIANKWAELFVEQNRELFITETGRSFDFIEEQFQEIESTLNLLEDKRRDYLAENPLNILEDELELKRVERFQETFLSISSDLELKEQEYLTTLSRVEELSVNGRWIGLQSNPSSDFEMPSSTPEQKDVLQAKKGLFDVQARIEELKQDTDLTLLRQLLNVKTRLLEDYITGLEAARNNFSIASKTLEDLKVQIQEHDQFLVLLKAIDDPALWEQLGLDPDKSILERLQEIGLRTQQVNPAYSGLTQRIIETRTNIETERERIRVLTPKVEETRSEVKELEKDISDTDTQLSRMQDELILALSRYNSEKKTYDKLQESLANLRNEVRTLTGSQASYNELVESSRREVQTLSNRISSGELEVKQMDREIKYHQVAFDQLASRIQGARIAKEEQSGSIRVVESAVVPQVSEARQGRQKVVIGGVLGLIAGGLAAFLVHYLRSPEPLMGRGRREEVPEEIPDEEPEENA